MLTVLGVIALFIFLGIPRRFPYVVLGVWLVLGLLGRVTRSGR